MHQIETWAVTPASKNHRSIKFRFSIRDLLWLTLVVALAVGWLADNRRLLQQRWGVMSQMVVVNDFAEARNWTDQQLEAAFLQAYPDPAQYKQRLADAKRHLRELLHQVESLEKSAK